MSDPCLQEFTVRVARIEQARAKGYGFEAEGTLGRSSLVLCRDHRPPKRRVLRGVVLGLLFATLLKAVLLQQLGPQSYDSRVVGLAGQTALGPALRWILHPDPATRAFAAGIDRVI